MMSNLSKAVEAYNEKRHPSRGEPFGEAGRHNHRVAIQKACHAYSEDLGEENAALVKENENLSMSIKGMASSKVNLNDCYQDLEGLYERLEKANAALKAEVKKLQEQIEGFGKVAK